MTMTDAKLSVRDVVKRYQSHTAVDRITLDVPRQSIFGLLGPNGAGKTSLIRMITQITMPDEGAILFDGNPIKPEHTQKIGYMPEERGLYKQMKIGDHVMYLAELRGLSSWDAEKKVKAWFERLDIMNWWNKKVEELSKGMQQKVQFVATVVHEPDLLILDEPFSGLDPINADLIKDEIHRLKELGATIIFSTHRMEQVEEICDRIALVHQGQNILNGEVKAIKQQFKKHHYRIQFDGALPQSGDAVYSIVSQKTGEAVIATQPGVSPNQLLTHLLSRVEMHAFQEVLPSLNEIFIEHVKGYNHA
ncbi:ATP-binding cassette domain-containing protein [bacterium]|nr:ATP-binding cassette domain-containing protein [bacterium]NUN46039.1 ABC transporter ATP-binding protein [bacterium]